LLIRILNSFRSNNLRVGLFDLAIIVLGLFMGFQLDRWNEERLRQQDAQAYLSQLADDLQADFEGSKTRIDYLSQVREHGISALALWDEAASYKPRDVVVSLYQASQIYPFIANTSTYEDLKSTGNIDLLGDTNIRSELFVYYNSHAVNFEVVGREAPYRMAVRGVIPFQVQDLIRGPCAYLVPGIKTTERLAENCEIELGEAEAERILSAVRQTPSLLQQLHFKLGQDMILINMLESQMVGAKTLIAALTSSETE